MVWVRVRVGVRVGARVGVGVRLRVRVRARVSPNPNPNPSPSPSPSPDLGELREARGELQVAEELEPHQDGREGHDVGDLVDGPGGVVEVRELVWRRVEVEAVEQRKHEDAQADDLVRVRVRIRVRV